eukprot:3349328-Prymnesium_polylepis.1
MARGSASSRADGSSSSGTMSTSTSTPPADNTDPHHREANNGPKPLQIACHEAGSSCAHHRKAGCWRSIQSADVTFARAPYT